MPLINLVDGFDIDEKNVALRPALPKSELSLSKFSSALFSYPKAFMIFWFFIISSENPDSSPRITDCFVNALCESFVITAAQISDSGVSMITMSAIRKSITSMKISVPIIVIIPVKNCVNP